MWIHLLVLQLIDGAGAPATITPELPSSGGEQVADPRWQDPRAAIARYKRQHDEEIVFFSGHFLP